MGEGLLLVYGGGGAWGGAMYSLVDPSLSLPVSVSV